MILYSFNKSVKKKKTSNPERWVPIFKKNEGTGRENNKSKYKVLAKVDLQF